MPSNKRRFFLLLVFFAFLLALLLSKDLLVYNFLKRKLNNALPGAKFSARYVRVWPSSFKITGFSIARKASSGMLPIIGSGDSASAIFSFPVRINDPVSYVRKAGLDIKNFEYGPFYAKEFSMQMERHVFAPFLRGRLRAGVLQYEKKTIKDLNVPFLLNRKEVLFNKASGSGFGGSFSLSGSIELQADKKPSFSGVILFKDIELKQIIDMFGGGSALDASGTYSGKTFVYWKDGQFVALGGELDSVSGGKFIIKDPSLAERLVTGIVPDKNSENIVIENLKNYYYDIGKIELRNSGADIKMEIKLQGKYGKRDLELFWHPKGTDNGQ